MNTRSRAAPAFEPNRDVALPIGATVRKPRWSHLRRRLRARQVGALRFVYYAFWDHCFVTLCAVDPRL